MVLVCVCVCVLYMMMFCDDVCVVMSMGYVFLYLCGVGGVSDGVVGVVGVLCDGGGVCEWDGV